MDERARNDLQEVRYLYWEVKMRLRIIGECSEGNFEKLLEYVRNGITLKEINADEEEWKLIKRKHGLIEDLVLVGSINLIALRM